MTCHWEVKLDPWEGREQGGWGVIFATVFRATLPFYIYSHDDMLIGVRTAVRRGILSSRNEWGAPVPRLLRSRNQCWSFGQSHETQSPSHWTGKKEEMQDAEGLSLETAAPWNPSLSPLRCGIPALDSLLFWCLVMGIFIAITSVMEVTQMQGFSTLIEY